MELTCWSKYLGGHPLYDVAKLADLPEGAQNPCSAFCVAAWTALSNKRTVPCAITISKSLNKCALTFSYCDLAQLIGL